MATKQRMTAQEYLALGESPTRSWLELVDGEVIVNEARMRHTVIHGNLLSALDRWIRAGRGRERGRVCVPLDVGLDDRNVYSPDLSWYAPHRVPDVEAPWPYSLPDLAVEIRSPSTWAYDIGAKKATYERHGLPELWLVDTAAEEVLVFRRSAPGAPKFDVALELARDQNLRSPLLPDFELALDEPFNLG